MPTHQGSIALRFAAPNLDSGNHKRLSGHAPTKTACFAANPYLVDLNMFIRVLADPIPVGPIHTSTEFVQNLKGGLVGLDPELPLKLDSTNASSIRGHQICSPKPHAEGRPGILHNGARESV
jgi:hypothetical protein